MLKQKSLFLILLILLAQAATAQIFKDWQWGDETEVYNDGGTRVTVSFYKSPQSCDPGGKSNRYRFNVSGYLQGNYKSIEVKFDYRNCQGNTVTISSNLNIGSGGQTGSIEGIDYKFTGTAVLHVYKVPVQAATSSLQGQPYYFFDDFSDNRNDWFTGTTSDYSLKIAANKYTIMPRIGFSSRGELCNLPVDWHKDFTCEVICKWIDGIKNEDFGLDFTCNTTTNSFYCFSVNPQGEYSLSFLENGKWTDIIPHTSSSYINLNNVPNILKVVKEGNYLSLFINDNLLKRIPFDGGYGSCFGMRVYASTTETQTVEFSNFKLTGYKK